MTSSELVFTAINGVLLGLVGLFVAQGFFWKPEPRRAGVVRAVAPDALCNGHLVALDRGGRRAPPVLDE